MLMPHVYCTLPILRNETGQYCCSRNTVLCDRDRVLILVLSNARTRFTIDSFWSYIMSLKGWQKKKVRMASRDDTSKCMDCIYIFFQLFHSLTTFINIWSSEWWYISLSIYRLLSKLIHMPPYSTLSYIILVLRWQCIWIFNVEK